jgi:hypothetical protein
VGWGGVGWGGVGWGGVGWGGVGWGGGQKPMMFEGNRHLTTDASHDSTSNVFQQYLDALLSAVTLPMLQVLG